MLTTEQKLAKTNQRHIWILHNDGFSGRRPRDYRSMVNFTNRNSRHFAKINKVLTRRIFADARARGVVSGGNPGPGHTCLGTVAGCYTCKSCLGRKPDLIPLNAWAKRQDAKRAPATKLPAKPKRLAGGMLYGDLLAAAGELADACLDMGYHRPLAVKVSHIISQIEAS
jgi:hypothetical protein